MTQFRSRSIEQPTAGLGILMAMEVGREILHLQQTFVSIGQQNDESSRRLAMSCTWIINLDNKFIEVSDKGLNIQDLAENNVFGWFGCVRLRASPCDSSS